MESFGAARKRGRPDAANGNGGFAGSKRAKGVMAWVESTVALFIGGFVHRRMLNA